MKKKLVALLASIFVLSHGQTRETLKAWVELANREEEDVKSDGKDPYDPDFLSFYQQKDPSVWGLLLVRLGLAEPLWNPYDLVPHLKAATLLQGGAVGERPFFKRLEVNKGAQIILIGNLHGALHSFIRDLIELKRLGFINERLELTGKSTYLVFLGNVINGTPYSLYLLELVLTIIEKNPQRAIYLRGGQETDSQWSDYFALRKQLKRWGHFWGEQRGLPLKKELNAFFAVLPDGIIFYHKDAPNELVMVGELARTVKKKKDDRVEAYVLGELPLERLLETDGLDFRGFDRGVATWTLLSSPTPCYQEALRFNDDTFCIFGVADRLRDSVFSVHYKHFRQKGDFKTKRYVVSLGLELTGKVLDAIFPTVTIGSSLALSGYLSQIGKGVKLGMELAMRRVNELGGVAGFYLKPLVLNDECDPMLARRNVKILLKKYRLDSLLCPQGTPTLAVYLDYMKQGALNLFFPITGLQPRDPSIDHLVNFRGESVQEVTALIDHITKQYASRRFVFLYQNDEFGIPLIAAAHAALEQRGIKTWVDIPLFRGQTIFDDSVKKFLKADPEAAGLFLSSSSLASSFLNMINIPFVVGRHFFTTTFLEDESFLIFLERTGIPMTISYVTPSPFSQLPLVEEYHREMKKNMRAEDSNSLEGYLATMIFVEAMSKAGAPFTGERVRAFLEDMNHYRFGGLNLTFDKQKCSFELPVSIRSEDGKWFKYE